MSDEIENVSKMVEEMREILSDPEDKMSLEERCKNDYSHFERLSPEQKKQAIANLKNMVKH